MGYRIVRVSEEMFSDLFTEGRVRPARDGERLVVTKGLPQGARLVGVFGELFFTAGQIVFKFEHPDWPDTPPGHAIPEVPVEFKLEPASPERSEVVHHVDGFRVRTPGRSRLSFGPFETRDAAESAAKDHDAAMDRERERNRTVDAMAARGEPEADIFAYIDATRSGPPRPADAPHVVGP